MKHLAATLKYRNELDAPNLFEFDPNGHLFTMIYSKQGILMRSESVNKFAIIIVENIVSEGIKLL